MYVLIMCTTVVHNTALNGSHLTMHWTIWLTDY